MKAIESKIRKLYFGSVIFLHIIAFTVIVISATYLRDIFYVEKRVLATVMIVGMVVYLVSVWQTVLNPKKIIVSSNGIRVCNLNSHFDIAYSAIDRIQKERSQMFRSYEVPITDSFGYSKIILKQGKPLIISPDKFENYLEIITFINAQLQCPEEVTYNPSSSD